MRTIERVKLALQFVKVSLQALLPRAKQDEIFEIINTLSGWQQNKAFMLLGGGEKWLEGENSSKDGVLRNDNRKWIEKTR